MRFEWDEAKRRANIAKHGFDFRDVEPIFDGRAVLDIPSTRHGEVRTLTIGRLDQTVVVVVWTERGEDAIRLISMRRANHAEEGQYRQLFS